MVGEKRVKIRFKKKLLHNLSCWAMILLPMLGFFLLQMIPLCISFFLGFTELHRYDFSAATWTGFSNYKFVLTDPLFWRAMLNTLYALLAIPLEMILGLLIASVLVKKIRGKNFFRTLFFIPYVCSSVAVTLMFQWFFDSELGIVNAFLSAIGIAKQPFFYSEAQFMPCMLVMMIWSGTGYYILLYQAALTNVNDSVLEAADLDGANAVQKFFHVTVPAISPTTFYLIVMGIIGGLQTFNSFQVVCSSLGQGMKFGPGNAGITVVYYLYDKGFENIFVYGMGIASAAAWIIAFIILVLTIFNFRLSKKWVQYDN